MQTTLAGDLASLDVFVTGAGYALPANTASAVASLFASGEMIFASTYESSVLPTRTIRVVDNGPALPARRARHSR